MTKSEFDEKVKCLNKLYRFRSIRIANNPKDSKIYELNVNIRDLNRAIEEARKKYGY